jgi:hypothetical protein
MAHRQLSAAVIWPDFDYGRQAGEHPWTTRFERTTKHDKILAEIKRESETLPSVRHLGHFAD